MLSALATVGPMFHGGFAFLPFFILGHILGFVLIVLLIVFAIGGRRRRWAHWSAMGNGGFGPWGNASHGAEATLAERFAQGDIDEKDYRARLEVLRANRGTPFPGK